MKPTRRLFWYELISGDIILKKFEEDEDFIWGRLMEYFNGNWIKATKYYRSHIGLTNKGVHKI